MRNRLARIGLALGAVGLALFAWGWSSARLEAPPPTPLLLDRDGGFLAQIPAVDGSYGYWEIADLPPRVVAATVALEDRRFWWHPGVDPAAAVRAIWQNVSSGSRVSGASTLAMQVARMQAPAARGYWNKAREAVTAVFLTLRYGREAVLRQYLRLAPYGNGSHGIAHAARFYLDKPVADLSWAEIAFLAAIPQAPSRMNPLSLDGRHDAAARGRRILDALRQGGVITEAEHRLALAQLAQLPLIDRRGRPENAMHAILALQRMFGSGAPPALSATDPRLVTTLDPEIQRLAAAEAGRAIGQWSAAGAEQVAAIVTRADTGEVLAWVGSAGYFVNKTGAIDFAQAERSPGSTLKPFIYALALDRGAIAPETRLLDTAYSAGTIANADRSYLGALTPRQALANSRNVPAANLVKAIGLDETFLYLRLLGLHDAERSAQYYGLSMSVGALPTTLERLVRAYGALANDGVMRDLVWVRGAAPSSGAPGSGGPGSGAASGQRVMSVDAARLVSLFLSDPSARLPSFPRMGTTEYPFPVAVKTGTSQGFRDAWTVAYSRRYLVGVWIGRSDAGPMRDVTGSAAAAALAQAIMLDLHGDADAARLAFPVPPHYRLQPICAGDAEQAPAVPVSAGQCGDTLPEWRRAAALPPAAPADPAALAETTLAETTLADPALGADPAAALTILSPKPNTRVIRNPELPVDLASLPLKVSATPADAQVTWFVDGKPFAVAPAQEVVRWPLVPGTHTFKAELAYRQTAAKPVTIEVQ
jgi:penicillin-binding protein 1C